MSLYGITVESAPDITTNGSGRRYPKILFRMTKKLSIGDPNYSVEFGKYYQGYGWDVKPGRKVIAWCEIPPMPKGKFK